MNNKIAYYRQREVVREVVKGVPGTITTTDPNAPDGKKGTANSDGEGAGGGEQ